MRIRRIVYPMTVSSSIVTDGNADVQYYDTSSGEFLPDLRITPYVFKLKATKIEGKDAEMQEVTSFVDATFHELVDGVWKPLSSGSDIELDASKATFKLKSNIQVGNFRTFRIDAKIADSRQAGKYAPISQQIQVYCKPMSEDAITLVPEYPDGRKMNILQKLDTYRLKALMRKGTSELNNVWYRWYRTDGGVETEITSANAGLLEGYDGPVLKIPAYGEIDTKTRHYRAVAHPQIDLGGINQISKSMIYDDLNDRISGVSVKGEDADGKYYALRIGTGGVNSLPDLFLNKVRYKSSQQYIISVKYKCTRTTLSLLSVNYTDGSKKEGKLTSTTISTVSIISESNKTVKSVNLVWSSAGFINIYDIKMIEYNGSNILSKSNKILSNAAYQIGVYNYAVKPTDQKKYILTVCYTLSENTTYIGIYWDEVQKKVCELRKKGAKVTETILVTAEAATTVTPFTAFNFLQFPRNEANGSIVYWATLVEGDSIVNETKQWFPADNEFTPAIADGLTPKPEFSDSDLSVRMAMSKVYPQPLNKELIVTSGGDLPVGVNMFEAECRLQSNTGTLENPEYDYSFVWKNRPASSGVWKEFARGRRILMPFTEEMDLDCVYTPGLDKAKYAACFDGVDDYIRANSKLGCSLYGDKQTVYEIEFEIDSLPTKNVYIFNIEEKDSTNKTRVTFGLTKTSFLFNITIGDVSKFCYIQENKLVPKRYKVKICLGLVDSVSTYFDINGVKEFPSWYTGQFSVSYSASIHVGNIYTFPFNGRILSLKVGKLNEIPSLYLDFQPVNGDRSTMLKNKNEDGSVNTENPMTFTANNIDNINELNPKYAFFKPI